MKRTENNILFDKPSGRATIQTGIVSIILLIVLLILAWNTSALNDVLEHSTAMYVKDVSYQLANDISARIDGFKVTLRQLADSIPRLVGSQLTEEFLERKARIMGFDTLIIIDREERTMPADFDLANLEDLSGVQNSFEGNESVIYIEGQHFLFSTPVYVNGKVEMVLLGLRRKENMQAIIQPKSFAGKSLTCITNRDGEVVISPTDLKPFMQLNDIFHSNTDIETKKAIRKMQDDMHKRQAGVFHFTAVDDTHLILAYQDIGVDGWVLLTLVPADLISAEANRYIIRTFIVVSGIILVFAVFLWTVIRFYKKNRKHLEKYAFSDQLTGGMNNTAFQMECQDLIQRAPLLTYTVVLLNVKGFKLVNENFGINVGNDVLRYIYAVLKRHLHAEELVARSVADHFFLCLKENDHQKIQARLDAMAKDINRFAKDTGIQYYPMLVQGACVIDEPDLDIMIIQDRVRTACQMQSEVGQCAFYSFELTQILKKEQELNTLFDSSIENRDFQVYLQPKICLEDGTIGGAEALVRWTHPLRGMIYPSDFIPVFEKSGNICKLDIYVFKEVCILLKKWMDNGKRLVPISVNISRRHFKELDFLRSLADIKEQYGIPDGIIELELTESIFFDQKQVDLVKNTIKQMHVYGFLCSLDDFGVGYSSLALLKEFDVDTIKLDKQFFGDITNPKTQNVIGSFIDLSDKLGIHVVSEGIETREQLEYLRTVHCDMVQGYIFSKPLSISDFEIWYKEHQKVML